ncbi:MAG: protein kinase [Myxococcaceae bacterium]|nr:protein kinase [Myxococcaceae bacterium]
MSGRYQYIRKLATGGMAEIHLAKTVGPGGFEKRLVVKRILPHLAERPEFLQMFFAEARIAAQLAHPNIVQIFDFGEEDGSHLIAMEYVDGLNLRTLAGWAKATAPMSCAVAARIISQACEGLAYAHEFVNPDTGQALNLVHRDVSADNIMVSRTGAVKVLDFGIARVEGDELAADQRKGKVAYMPPEQLRGDELDLRVDVFALGVVLYLLLAGERPWERTTELALIRAVLQEPPSPLRDLRPDVPIELEKIVMRALSRARDERHRSCRELQAALEVFISQSGETITPTTLGVFVTRALAAGAGSGQPPGPSVVAQATPQPASRPSPQHLAVTTPGVMTPLLKEFARTVAGAPSPALLARLRAEAAEEDGGDLGPEPTTNRMPSPLWGPARDLLQEQATVVIAPRPSPGRPPPRASDPHDEVVTEQDRPAATRSGDAAPPGGPHARAGEAATLRMSAVKALTAGAGDAAHTLKVPTAHLFAPPPDRSADAAADDFFQAAPAAAPFAIAPSPPKGATSGPPPPQDASFAPPPAGPEAPAPGLFAPPPPPRHATGGSPPAPLPDAELFAAPPPRGDAAAPDLFAPPPPPKRATGGFPPAPPLETTMGPGAPAAELFAPPPPPRHKTGGFPPAPLEPPPGPGAPTTELFAPPPPPKHTTGGFPPAPLEPPPSPGAPTAELFAPPPPPKHTTGGFPPAPAAELFAPPPPPKRATGGFPPAPPLETTTGPGAPEAELFAPPPRSSPRPAASPLPSSVAPPAGADLFTPPPPSAKRPSGAFPAAPPEPRSSAPGPRASSPSGLRPQAPVAVRGFEAAQVLAHRPARGLPPAVLAALRGTAAADRAHQLMRRFPLIAARLIEVDPALTAPIEHLGGAMLDALLLADEHQLLLRLIERTKSGHFAGWLRDELLSPVRMLALTDRLRLGAPADAESLHGWLCALGPAAIPQLVAVIDALEPGLPQDVLCRALAVLVSSDPSLVAGRLDETPARNAAAMAFVLEATGSSERSKLFSRIYARRDVRLTVQVMSGRARVKSAETLGQLATALADRTPEVRLHALKLIAELDNPAGGRLLFDRTEDASFEKLPDDERAATWSALAQIRDPQTFSRLSEVLGEKTTLLGRKQSIAKKLAIIDGLRSSALEEAQALLVRAAEDRSQPDEVLNAASRALLERRPSGLRSVADENAWLRRLACLDLCSLVRAASVVDLTGGQLDPALSRLRDVLRRLVAQSGRFELVVGGEGLLLGGASVPLQLGTMNVAPQVTRWLSERDLQSVTLEGPVPVAELRAFLLQLCDPDGTVESAPHIRCTTFSGRAVGPHANQLVSGDQGAKAAELYRAAIDFLVAQRRAFFAGVLPDVLGADELLRHLARTWASSDTRLLSVIADPAGDDAFAVHAVNTACIGMAFANDLQLGLGALREIAEVSLFWTLAETGLSPQRQATPGAAMHEDVRLRLATLFLSQEKGRRAIASAVATIDAGLDAPPQGQRGAGHVATIIALAEAFDALALGARLGHLAALGQLQTAWAHRFNPELLGLFVAWATEQCGSRPPPTLTG